MTRGRRPTETEDQPQPSVDPSVRGREALIAVFPRAAASPVPYGREPVGRSWLEALGLPDRRVSERHLLFSRPGGQPFLEDAGSRNGTWVNGARLGPGERAALADGAVVRAGSTLLVFREELLGEFAPAPPLCRMVGPYGLRSVAEALAGFQRVAPSNVLIEGESGAGKELAAEAVAVALGRHGVYGAVNMAAIPASLFEAHLFGHTAGAFSGATKASRGFIAAHDGGTVFLDEIGELPAELQPKLLRLLENREVQPVGAERAHAVDLLLIAATNRPLEDAANQGTFRPDLLARLARARVDLPPLRERPEDLFAILQAGAAARGMPFLPELIEVESLERLMLHPWKLNIRELLAVLDRLLAIAPGALPLWAVERVLGPAPTSLRPGALVAEQVAQIIALCQGNETEAARRLGVSRGKLRRFLARGRL